MLLWMRGRNIVLLFPEGAGADSSGTSVGAGSSETWQGKVRDFLASDFLKKYLGTSWIEDMFVEVPPLEVPLKGTVFFGGAGLDGHYIDDMVNALQEAGISYVSPYLNSKDTSGELPDAVAITSLNNIPENTLMLVDQHYFGAKGVQFNLIGYSYGALLAAHIAHSYTNLYKEKEEAVVDHLVLIGAPINASFLKALQQNPKIKKVIIIDLTEHGDPVYAGMSDSEIVAAVPILFMQQKEEIGHFYYAGYDREGKERRRELAKELYAMGLR